MRLQVWKYPLLSGSTLRHDKGDALQVTLEMPEAAKPLTVQIQNGRPTMWALVDPEASKEKRMFAIIGTGIDLPKTMKHFAYVGTFQLEDKGLVFHVFEILSK